ncbi:hypothetical protein SOASR031_25330 [Leminorella grimontii]|nr:hypothetical protein SOASR031_25330 [Leminorella grimontii]
MRTKDGFINCINFQKKSTGDAFFINMGVHPTFYKLYDESLPNKEIMCEIRSRMVPEEGLCVDLLDSPDGISHIVNVMENNWHFFDFFNSTDNVFSPIGIENIEGKKLPVVFRGVTDVRLTLMCMYYHIFKGDKDKTISFAEYGLSIVEKSAIRISGPKKAFKQALKNIDNVS